MRQNTAGRRQHDEVIDERVHLARGPAGPRRTIGARATKRDGVLADAAAALRRVADCCARLALTDEPPQFRTTSSPKVTSSPRLANSTAGDNGADARGLPSPSGAPPYRCA